MLLVVSVLLGTRAIGAQSVPGSATVPSAEELAAFFEEHVPELLDAFDVPGAIVTVVTSQGPSFEAGFGRAALDPDRPATGDTPFAAGSVAKLFVWTSVMQLVERGELDLDADVNTYLDFEIPARAGQAITLRHLMTHTAGFEDYPLIGVFARDEDAIPVLGDVLADRIPERVRAPGVESAYSNYGSALAGYIVERVSERPYADYVASEILEPLGMTESSVRLPASEDLRDDAALGYVPVDGRYIPFGNEFLTIAPAGTLLMTAHDAGRFLRAYLGDGSVDGGRMLQPATVERMRTTLFAPDPSLPGNAYGFWESVRHGERILQHTGDTEVFAAHLALMPDRSLGYYLATNAPGGLELREFLWEAFLDAFYPAEPARPTANVAPEDLDRYVGTYLPNRASTSSLGKIVNLFTTLDLRRDGDRLTSTVYGVENTWLPTGTDRFADASREGEEILFRTGSNGRLEAYFSEAPMLVFRSARWYEVPMTHVVLVATASVLLVIGLIGFPLLAWLDRRRGVRRSVGARAARWTGTATAVLLLAFGGLFSTAMTAPLGPQFGVSPLLAAGLAIAPIAAGLVGLHLVLVLVAWLRRWWGPVGRIHATVVLVGGLVLVWQMSYWNVVGGRI